MSEKAPSTVSQQDKLRVGIIVEKESGPNITTKRKNFWHTALNRLETNIGSSVFMVDVPPQELPNLANYDILIVRWDSTNDDLRTGSDEVYDQIKKNSDRLRFC